MGLSMSRSQLNEPACCCRRFDFSGQLLFDLIGRMTFLLLGGGNKRGTVYVHIGRKSEQVSTSAHVVWVRGNYEFAFIIV